MIQIKLFSNSFLEFQLLNNSLLNMKDFPFKNLFIIHVRGKKYQCNKKWPRLGLSKIWPKSNHSKVHSYLFIKFFAVIFLIHIFFPSSIINWVPIKNIEMKFFKKSIGMLMQNWNCSPYVHFKSPLSCMVSVCLLNFAL